MKTQILQCLNYIFIFEYQDRSRHTAARMRQGRGIIIINMMTLLPPVQFVFSDPRAVNAWNNGNRHPRGGVAEIQKMSPPTTVGDAADMQLCVVKQGSPPVLENVAFFVTDLLTLARCAVCILNISVGME